MKVTKSNIQGTVVKDNEVYQLEDNYLLKNLTLSKTTLHPNQNTNGHSHVGVEEVYFFEQGQGIIALNDDKYEVSSGDVILIPDGVFHKVWNTSSEDLIFICVFQAYDKRKDNPNLRNSITKLAKS